MSTTVLTLSWQEMQAYKIEKCHCNHVQSWIKQMMRLEAIKLQQNNLQRCRVPLVSDIHIDFFNVY